MKLAAAGFAALLSHAAAAQPVEAEDYEAKPATPMAQCIRRITERTTAENAPLAKPASFAKCFEPSEVRDPGDVMLRFSSQPALGGVGYEVSIRPYNGQVAAVRVVILDGHPEAGWIEMLSAYSDIPREQFDRLRKSFEAALSAPLVSPTVIDSRGDEVIIVCTDGPGYLAEVVEPSGTRELEGFCGDHPNRRLAAEIEGIKSAAVSQFAGDSAQR
ncbi:hypothetical protein [Erythrobacter oryzae]|uniref:hypothetical protein n=1 Tax=Erythrobacter oryzae TaxID=3019556 RepID=UPI002553A226|nr:hypothetical protein [Erythrobacter sp. COR-2]